MPTVRDVVDLLSQRGLLATGRPIAASLLERRVNALASDGEAREGTLSWLSPTAQDPLGRIGAFRGAALIVSGAHHAAHPDGATIGSDAPKLAFSIAAAVLFPDSVRTPWPSGSATVDPSATIEDGVTLSTGVVVGERVSVGRGSSVGPNTCIANATIGRDVIIGANCTIGGVGFGYDRSEKEGWVLFPHVGQVIVHDGVHIGNNTCIDRGALGDTIIGPGSRIDNLVHIAHNVVTGRDVLVIANAMVAGSVRIEDGAWISPSASILNQKHVGAGAIVGLGAVVLRDVEAHQTVVGNPAKPLGPRVDAKR